ncbi:sulfotransferase [Xanthomonas sp. AmX2]|uniref:tetratricopeptide repeat-containing sulfotransferase family protein n=1 Tax=Xanthomonas sp. TaxID=29446 RepID=UPI00197DCDD8|nr:tetratricopeptide repeat-containing sulfotransferase family protein [Xanthomonas sp.]MBN6152025.1 sulfotransferase [Xanthomonas sp.]
MSASTDQDYSRLLAQAEAQAGRQQLHEAIETYQRALQQRPDDAHVLLQLSYLHSLTGRYRAGRQYALRANAAHPTSPQVLAELIPRLRTFNEVPALLECVQRLLPLQRIPIPLLLTLASQLTYVNLPERAIVFLDEARRADPDYPPTLLARAQVLIYLGRFDDAAQDLSRALARAPEIAQGYWLQAFLGTQTHASHHVDAIRAQLRRQGRTPAELALLGFALHKELDDLGEHAGAWDALMQGCRAKRSTLRYSAQESAALFEALMQARPAGRGDVPQGGPGPTPIFIVGMHRSGTTLLEQMLDASPEVRGIGELYDFTSAMRQATDHHCRGVVDATVIQRAAGADLADAGRHYLHGLRWRLQDEPFFTDKLPSNFLNAGLIASALPQAKILHMVRDPVETCFSNLRELFSEANPYSYDLHELAQFHNGYRRLMRHWHQTLPGRILDVSYARLLEQPDAVMGEVSAFCGLSSPPSLHQLHLRKRSVVTASAVQVRAPLRAPALAKWRPYAQQLQPLVQALRD